ncbi:hypothetical protein G9A89_000346 [Geosiphon pyriformis]|nr:hypothetical protein G9A89_000346 [Geosiphon pyriformis]
MVLYPMRLYWFGYLSFIPKMPGLGIFYGSLAFLTGGGGCWVGGMGICTNTCRFGPFNHRGYKGSIPRPDYIKYTVYGARRESFDLPGGFDFRLFVLVLLKRACTIWYVGIRDRLWGFGGMDSDNTLVTSLLTRFGSLSMRHESPCNLNSGLDPYYLDKYGDPASYSTVAHSIAYTGLICVGSGYFCSGTPHRSLIQTWCWMDLDQISGEGSSGSIVLGERSPVLGPPVQQVLGSIYGPDGECPLIIGSILMEPGMCNKQFGILCCGTWIVGTWYGCFCVGLGSRAIVIGTDTACPRGEIPFWVGEEMGDCEYFDGMIGLMRIGAISPYRYTSLSRYTLLSWEWFCKGSMVCTVPPLLGVLWRSLMGGEIQGALGWDVLGSLDRSFAPLTLSRFVDLYPYGDVFSFWPRISHTMSILYDNYRVGIWWPLEIGPFFVVVVNDSRVCLFGMGPLLQVVFVVATGMYWFPICGDGLGDRGHKGFESDGYTQRLPKHKPMTPISLEAPPRGSIPVWLPHKLPIFVIPQGLNRCVGFGRAIGFEHFTPYFEFVILEWDVGGDIGKLVYGIQPYFLKGVLDFYGFTLMWFVVGTPLLSIEKKLMGLIWMVVRAIWVFYGPFYPITWILTGIYELTLSCLELGFVRWCQDPGAIWEVDWWVVTYYSPILPYPYNRYWCQALSPYYGVLRAHVVRSWG